MIIILIEVVVVQIIITEVTMVATGNKDLTIRTENSNNNRTIQVTIYVSIAKEISQFNNNSLNNLKFHKSYRCHHPN